MTHRPDGSTTLFYLPAFGLSARTFDDAASRLPDGFDVVGIDLPGFGDAAGSHGYTTPATVDYVIEVIRRAGASRWVLVGHSRGGRMATLVAARVLRGDAPVFGMAGVVLLSASPPDPEPMDADTRARMLSWAAGHPLDEAAAREFVDANVAAPLAPDADALAVADLQRSDPAAWRAWLETGSKQDFTNDVGVLDLPALIVAGGQDPLLGPDAQRALNGRVYPRAEFLVLEKARHLLPLEDPTAVAEAIVAFHRDRIATAPAVPADYASVLAGTHMSARTRGILARRGLADDDRYRPQTLTAAQLDTLRALADTVVPQGDGAGIDIAARVDAQLARGEGDGWRNAALPPDADAYRAALDALAGFADRDAEDRRVLVQDLVDGSAQADGSLDAGQLQAWFADARTDLVRQWLAHPATMARIGFDGFATGGDSIRMQGFDLLAAGTREPWEPPGVASPAPGDGVSLGHSGDDAERKAS